ncbi:TPA: hypothetical protein ACH3X1_011365 [Trebouxia sp. C0004]
MQPGLFGDEGLEVGLETGLGVATRAPTGVGDNGGGAATDRTPAGLHSLDLLLPAVGREGTGVQVGEEGEGEQEMIGKEKVGKWML